VKSRKKGTYIMEVGRERERTKWGERKERRKGSL